MENIDSIYLLSIILGLTIVFNENNIIIANISRNEKDGVKHYLNESTKEFKVLKIDSTLFGFTIKIKVLDNIVFSAREDTLPNKDNTITTIDLNW
jgi:hypothetical protein